MDLTIDVLKSSTTRFFQLYKILILVIYFPILYKKMFTVKYNLSTQDSVVVFQQLVHQVPSFIYKQYMP